jgi:hypothetical protein
MKLLFMLTGAEEEGERAESQRERAKEERAGIG